jgi:hypothetical protein
MFSISRFQYQKPSRRHKKNRQNFLLRSQAEATKMLDMKKLLLASMFVALALAVQAGDAKASKVQTTSKDASPCCSTKTTTLTSTTAKGAAVTADKGKTACCSESGACKDTPSRRVLLSPKAAELARK